MTGPVRLQSGAEKMPPQAGAKGGYKVNTKSTGYLLHKTVITGIKYQLQEHGNSRRRNGIVFQTEKMLVLHSCQPYAGSRVQRLPGSRIECGVRVNFHQPVNDTVADRCDGAAILHKINECAVTTYCGNGLAAEVGFQEKIAGEDRVDLMTE